MKIAMNRGSAWPTVRTLLIGAGICLFLNVASLFGQTTFGSITGTVTDNTGAVIPGASVTIRNEGTGVERSVLTTSSGVYVIPNLDLGTYSVRVEKQGFAAYRAGSLQLNANQVIDVDAQLTISTAASSVEVVGAAPTINTQTPTLNNVTTPTELEQLPVITRQKGDEGLWGYEAYNVGISHAPFFTANGSRYIDTQPTVDGITAMSFQSGVGGSTVQPGIEATAEVSVQLANAPAEFGRPVQMTMVSKSGTNAFHGSVFEDYNGNDLNARNFFSSSVPFRVYNDFGASLGGPIIKNKTFFFADYEGSRESTAVINTLNVPLAAWQSGNFSGLSTVIKNPYTGVPFPGNIIPSSMISPVSQRIQSLYYPLPNYGPSDLEAGNFRDLLHPGNNGVTIFDRFDARIDHNFSPRDTLYGRLSYSRMPIQAYVANSVPPFGFRDSLRVADSAVLSWSHTFSPNLLNELRGGYTRDNNQIRSSVIGSNILSQVGIQGIGVTGIPVYPEFSISGLTTAAQVPYFLGIGTDFQVTDNLSWIKGSHTFKFGFDVIRDREISSYYSGNLYGDYSFRGAFTGAPYADFLLGLPASTADSVPVPVPHTFGSWWSAYAQDQYKVTRNLTLSYGIRWEAQLPYSDNRGNLASFNPVNGDIVVADAGISHINPEFPKNIPIETASQAGYPTSTLLASHHAYFYPRFGAAYRPFGSSKTVIRGGYGIYGLTTYGSGAFFFVGGPFSGSETFVNNITNGKAAFSFPDPFLPLGAGQTPAQFIDGVNPNLRIGYMQQWNLTIERQVGGFVLGASYVGTHTVNIPYERNIDQPVASTTPFSISALPYPNYASVDWVDNGATERYNALQLYVRRTFGTNLFLNAGFTWAKDLTDAQDQSSFSGLEIQNAYDRAADNGPNSFVVPTRFFANVVYSLPLGKGQRFLSSIPRPADWAIGGWRMAWNITAEAGPYYTPTFDGPDSSNTNAINTNNAPLRPDRIGNTFVIPGCSASDPLCPNPVDVGRFGNSGVNVLEAPGLVDVDLSLMKDFRVTERFTLQFRGTATNVFNHPNFGTPGNDISSPGTYGVVTSTTFDLYGQQSRSIDFMLRLRF
jgi:hypothetical protein